MHDSLRRLLECARAATADEPPSRRITDLSGVAKRLTVSPQGMTNWKTRGVSKEQAIQAELEFGCSAAWLLHGQHPAERLQGWTPEQHSSGGARPRGAVAQILSHVRQSHSAPRIAWEELVTVELPYHFEVLMPDDSMAPWILSGDIVRFRRGTEPRRGEVVLVVDSVDRAYVRTYRPRSATEWLARPENDDYAELDSTRDGLRVLAVFAGLERSATSQEETRT